MPWPGPLSRSADKTSNRWKNRDPFFQSLESALMAPFQWPQLEPKSTAGAVIQPLPAYVDLRGGRRASAASRLETCDRRTSVQRAFSMAPPNGVRESIHHPLRLRCRARREIQTAPEYDRRCDPAFSWVSYVCVEGGGPPPPRANRKLIGPKQLLRTLHKHHINTVLKCIFNI